MTSNPTSRSATARDIRKKLVAFWSFLSNDTARMTRMFPPMVGMITRKMSSAAQWSGSPSWLDSQSSLTVWLSLLLAILLRKVVLLFFPWARPALSQTPFGLSVVQMMHLFVCKKSNLFSKRVFKEFPPNYYLQMKSECHWSHGRHCIDHLCSFSCRYKHYSGPQTDL